jgi:hypothetical protein
MKKLFLLSTVLTMSMLGCGSTDGLLNTSQVTSTIDTLVLDSDVVSWVDPVTGAKSTACSPSSPAVPAADSVNVAVSSKAYSNTGTSGLSVRIEAATIIYTPANASTPPMATEYQAVGTTIANGGSVTVPVRVVSQEQKVKSWDALACKVPIYNYYTRIILDVTEIGTNKKTTTEVSMQLRMADYIDK